MNSIPRQHDKSSAGQKYWLSMASKKVRVDKDFVSYDINHPRASYKKSSAVISPTQAQFWILEEVYNHFNRELFQGTPPPALLNFSPHGIAMGFAVKQLWSKGKDDRRPLGTILEISLSPKYLYHPLEEVYRD